MNEKEIRFIDLFAGIGGFRFGLEAIICEKKRKRKSGKKEISKDGERLHTERGRNERNGNSERQSSQHNTNRLGCRQFTCVYTNEWDKYAAQIYRKHFGECDERDITTVDANEIPDHDLLCGGFPCQSFSIAGKRRGFNDTRGTLFFDIARILKEKHPRLLLLENVKGLLSHDNGNTFKTVISTLDELGYDLQWQVLNSKNFGVPQNRERVFIIGHLRGTPRPKVFPITRDSQENETVAVPRETFPSDKVADTLTVHYAKNQHGNQYVAEESEEERPMEIRRLTPTECERLQGFPDNWTEGISDTQRYKCLGNAVTVNVVEEIGKRLL